MATLCLQIVFFVRCVNPLKSGRNCMDLLPVMFVMSCNCLQQYTELKLLVVMRQVLRCTCSFNPILHQRDQQGDYLHNRSPCSRAPLSWSNVQGRHSQQRLLPLTVGSETNTSRSRTNFKFTHNDFQLPITKRKPKPFASSFGRSSDLALSVTTSHTALRRERLLSSSY